MKTEPVLSAVRKARADFKKTPAGKLEALFAEETRWKRKLTIASNKLEHVRRRINCFCIDYVPSGKGGND